MIFSIGYERLPLHQLILIAKSLDAIIYDVRSKPQSHNTIYNRSNLVASLPGRYMWLGETLGGFGVITDDNIDTLAREANGIKVGGIISGHFTNIILLCTERAPGRCHRFANIGKRLLADYQVDVAHIFADEVVLQSELELSFRDNNDYICYDLGDVLDGSVFSGLDSVACTPELAGV